MDSPDGNGHDIGDGGNIPFYATPDPRKARLINDWLTRRAVFVARYPKCYPEARKLAHTLG